MSGYVRGTCHTSKASFLLQLYLLNLISGVRGGGGRGEERGSIESGNQFPPSVSISFLYSREGGEERGQEERERGFRTSIRRRRRRRVSCTITNFESKVPWKKRKEGGKKKEEKEKGKRK